MPTTLGDDVDSNDDLTFKWMAGDGLRDERDRRRRPGTLDVGMEEIGGGGADTRPTQIALVFDAGSNCVGDTVGWEVNVGQSAEGRRYTTIN
jgi:hypothetical protein